MTTKTRRMNIALLVAAATVFATTVSAGPPARNTNLDPNTFDVNGRLCNRTNGTQQSCTPMQLWMGVGNQAAGMLVGHVTFHLTAPPNKGHVRIVLSDLDGTTGPDMFPFVATDIHIHFAPTVDGIPRTKNGNPIPGQFEYNVPVSDPKQTVYLIPVEFDAVGAIHLSVYRYGGVEGFNFWLPDNQVTLRIVDYPSPGDPTYFKLKVTNGGFISDYDMGYGPGIYEAWCVDVDHTIYLNQDYPAYLFSSYETLPDWLTGSGKLEYPENLDKVNYLVNHFATGQLVQPMNADCTPVVSPPEALTYSDIQRAIWHYVDDNQSTAGLSAWSQQRVNAIICATNANGEGFVPDCTQKIVFIVVPVGSTPVTIQLVVGQPVIGEIAVQCTSASGTAWGDGKYGARFPGASQWGTWFRYDAASTVCQP